MDISSIAAMSGSLKSAFELAKAIKNSYESYDKAEIKNQMADLLFKLADTKIELAEIQELLIAKDNKIRELEATLHIKKNVKFERPFYYLIENDQKDGPYCQTCYDSNIQLIRLQTGYNNYWSCLNCGNSFIRDDDKDNDL